jgi:hypothetical protein
VSTTILAPGMEDTLVHFRLVPLTSGRLHLPSISVVRVGGASVLSSASSKDPNYEIWISP